MSAANRGPGATSTQVGSLTALNIVQRDVDGNVVSASGTQYTEGNTDSSITGTAALAEGAGGAAGTIPVIGSMPLAGLGQFALIAGQVGVAGGVQTGAVGANTTIATTSCLTQGGAGGAGVTAADFAGGGVTAINNSFMGTQIPASAVAGSNPGSSGQTVWKPFFNFAGMGGASSNAGVGGGGGTGAFGSGGGGGGGGTTGGLGGSGGSGLVVIVSW